MIVRMKSLMKIGITRTDVIMRTKMMLTVILMPVLPSSICAWSVIESPRRAVVALQVFLIVVVVPQFWKTGLSFFLILFLISKYTFALPVQIKTDRSKSSSSQHQKEEKSRGGCGHRPEFSYWIILVRLQRTCVVYVISLYCSYIDSNGFVIQLIAFPEGKSRS